MNEYTNRKQLGALGEQAAVKHLVSRGYRIMERNWRCRLGEIDAIAMDGSWLVFVEVRTRSTANFGTGAESVDLRKQHKLRQLAASYLRQHHMPAETRLRFDVISVKKLEAGKFEIDHIEHAF